MDLTALINFLDIHSGTITAIATIALAIVTIFLVRATIQLANITKNQDKPWLHFYFMLGDVNHISNPDRLYVKNIGKGAAFDVKFSVKIGGVQNHQLTLDALAPNQEFVILKLLDNVEYEIDETTYKDINKKPINQPKIEPKTMNFNTYAD